MSIYSPLVLQAAHGLMELERGYYVSNIKKPCYPNQLRFNISATITTHFLDQLELSSISKPETVFEYYGYISECKKLAYRLMAEDPTPASIETTLVLQSVEHLLKELIKEYMNGRSERHYSDVASYRAAVRIGKEAGKAEGDTREILLQIRSNPEH